LEDDYRVPGKKCSTTQKMITGYKEKTIDHPSDGYRVPGRKNY
jgi:hypothetical protein